MFASKPFIVTGWFLALIVRDWKIRRSVGRFKNRLPGDGDSFTALLAILIARARSVGNVAYLFV